MRAEKAREAELSETSSQDYLSSELRQQVEQLKVDVAAKAITTENIGNSARILWAWANAYAMVDGVFNPDIPVLIAIINRNKINQELSNKTLFSYFERFVKELQLRDEQPHAIGTLTASNFGPFAARSYQTIEQTYTVGEKPILPGGGFLIAKQLFSNHGSFQTENPAGDNYISIKSSNPNAKFKVDSFLLLGSHGGLRNPRPTLVFRLEGTTLKQGDTVTITYGDTSGGGRGFLMQHFSNDGFSLPLYLDFDGSDLSWMLT